MSDVKDGMEEIGELQILKRLCSDGFVLLPPRRFVERMEDIGESRSEAQCEARKLDGIRCVLLQTGL